MLYILLYTICIILLSLSTYDYLKNNKLTNNFLFLIITNIILNITIAYFYYILNNIIYTTIFSFFLMILAFLFIRLFNKDYKYNLATLPYLLLSIYTFCHSFKLLLDFFLIKNI